MNIAEAVVVESHKPPTRVDILSSTFANRCWEHVRQKAYAIDSNTLLLRGLHRDYADVCRWSVVRRYYAEDTKIKTTGDDQQINRRKLFDSYTRTLRVCDELKQEICIPEENTMSFLDIVEVMKVKHADIIQRHSRVGQIKRDGHRGSGGDRGAGERKKPRLIERTYIESRDEEEGDEDGDEAPNWRKWKEDRDMLKQHESSPTQRRRKQRRDTNTVGEQIEEIDDFVIDDENENEQDNQRDKYLFLGNVLNERIFENVELCWAFIQIENGLIPFDKTTPLIPSDPAITPLSFTRADLTTLILDILKNVTDDVDENDVPLDEDHLNVSAVIDVIFKSTYGKEHIDGVPHMPRKHLIENESYLISEKNGNLFVFNRDTKDSTAALSLALTINIFYKYTRYDVVTFPLALVGRTTMRALIAPDFCRLVDYLVDNTAAGAAFLHALRKIMCSATGNAQETLRHGLLDQFDTATNMAVCLSITRDKLNPSTLVYDIPTVYTHPETGRTIKHYHNKTSDTNYTWTNLANYMTIKKVTQELAMDDVDTPPPPSPKHSSPNLISNRGVRRALLTNKNTLVSIEAIQVLARISCIDETAALAFYAIDDEDIGENVKRRVYTKMATFLEEATRTYANNIVFDDIEKGSITRTLRSAVREAVLEQKHSNNALFVNTGQKINGLDIDIYYDLTLNAFFAATAYPDRLREDNIAALKKLNEHNNKHPLHELHRWSIKDLLAFDANQWYPFYTNIVHFYTDDKDKADAQSALDTILFVRDRMDEDIRKWLIKVYTERAPHQKKKAPLTMFAEWQVTIGSISLTTNSLTKTSSAIVYMPKPTDGNSLSMVLLDDNSKCFDFSTDRFSKSEEKARLFGSPPLSVANIKELFPEDGAEQQLLMETVLRTRKDKATKEWIRDNADTIAALIYADGLYGCWFVTFSDLGLECIDALLDRLLISAIHDNGKIVQSTKKIHWFDEVWQEARDITNGGARKKTTTKSSSSSSSSSSLKRQEFSAQKGGDGGLLFYKIDDRLHGEPPLLFVGANVTSVQDLSNVLYDAITLQESIGFATVKDILTMVYTDALLNPKFPSVKFSGPGLEHNFDWTKFAFSKVDSTAYKLIKAWVLSKSIEDADLIALIYHVTLKRSEYAYSSTSPVWWLSDNDDEDGMCANSCSEQASSSWYNNINKPWGTGKVRRGCLCLENRSDFASFFSNVKTSYP